MSKENYNKVMSYLDVMEDILIEVALNNNGKHLVEMYYPHKL